MEESRRVLEVTIIQSDLLPAALIGRYRFSAFSPNALPSDLRNSLPYANTGQVALRRTHSVYFIMSIRGLLTGFATAGAATVAYNQKIYSTSDTLRQALTSLSKDLDSFRIQSNPEKALAAPQAWENLALGEQVKLQVGTFRQGSGREKADVWRFIV